MILKVFIITIKWYNINCHFKNYSFRLSYVFTTQSPSLFWWNLQFACHMFCHSYFLYSFHIFKLASTTLIHIRSVLQLLFGTIIIYIILFMLTGIGRYWLHKIESSPQYLKNKSKTFNSIIEFYLKWM